MKRLPHIPQLDSFRFIAVAMVMISHWVPKYNTVPWGFLGVTFFFVLSGYLITANLLYLKAAIDRREISIGAGFRIFYSRRTLRIFPLYYFAILVVYLLGKQLFEGNVIWYITYVPNFLVLHQHRWPGMLSHFWSLGVEEQFYLLWPLLIFFVRNQRVKYLFIGTILVSVLFKVAIFHPHGPFFTYNDVLPISNFDAFGIGALLAWLSLSRENKAALERIPFGLGSLVSAGLAFLFYWTGLSFLFGVGVSAVSFFLIRQAQTGFPGVAGKLLSHPIPRYLGRISYGLYVYHNFMPWIWRCINGTETENLIGIPGWKSAFLARPVVALTGQFILLVVIASLSWFLLEQPLLKLKDRAAGAKASPAILNK